MQIIDIFKSICKYRIAELLFTGRYLIEKGARDSGKSYELLGLKVLYDIFLSPLNNAVIVRQNDNSNKQSTFNHLVNLINKYGLQKYFNIRINPLEITYLATGQVIYFRGANHPDAIKSIVAPIGFLNRLYIEEANEIPDYETFNTIDKSIRRPKYDPRRYKEEDYKNAYCQIVCIFNGISADTWLNEEFFKGRLEDSQIKLEKYGYQYYENDTLAIGNGVGLYLATSSTLINEYREPEVDIAADALKLHNLERWRVDYLGMWGQNGETPYPNFSNKNIISPEEVKRLFYQESCIGIDVGLSNGAGKILKNGEVGAATVCELCATTVNYKKQITLEEYFHTNENNPHPKTAPELYQEIARTFKEWEQEFYMLPNVLKGTIYVFVDSADVGFRQSLEDVFEKLGMRNYRFIASTKKPILDRVRYEDLLYSFSEKLISSKCKNLIREISTSKTGKNGSARADGNDHAINADEYGHASMVGQMMRYKNEKHFNIN